MIQLSFLYDYVLANTIMPNATPIEMGVIQYIHTLYSNKIKNGSLFDQNVESEHSPMRMIFGDLYSIWPNSLGGPTHLQMPCYESMVKVSQSSVYLGKKNNKKYIYPIKVSYHLEEFTGNYSKGNKINGEHFWKHISIEVLADVKAGRALILLDWANENFVSKETFKNLHTSLRYSNIPKSQVVLVFNSFNAEDVYNSWFTPDEQQLIVVSLPFLLSHTSFHYNKLFANTATISNFLGTKNNIRKHKFLFKIRRARDYRVAMLHTLASNNLLSEGDWSCLDVISSDEGLKKSKKYRDDINVDIVTNLHNQLPHTLESEPYSSYNSVNGWGDKHSDASKSSYFYIASETFMNSEYKFVTEKVFKPLVHFQPFLFLSYPGALKELQALGFRTFHPYIDESYDTEPDEVVRFNLIYKEIARLCSMSKEELHSWYWSMEDILVHNHWHSLTLHNNEPYALKALKYLQDKLN